MKRLRIKTAHTMNSSYGFTLLELIIVITIIGILITIFIVSQTTARDKSQNASVLFQIEEYVKALEIYHADTGVYPTGGTVESASDRTQAYCIFDGYVNGPPHCLPPVPGLLRPVNTDADNSLIRIALKQYMGNLPGFNQVSGEIRYASPAYSGCIGVGTTNQSCNPILDYSFWFVLKGSNQDCGRAIVVESDIQPGGYTLCRRQPILP